LPTVPVPGKETDFLGASELLRCKLTPDIKLKEAKQSRHHENTWKDLMSWCAHQHYRHLGGWQRTTVVDAMHKQFVTIWTRRL